MSTLAKRKRTGNDASDPSDAGRKKVRPAAASTIEIKNSGRIKRYVSRACAYLKVIMNGSSIAFYRLTRWVCCVEGASGRNPAGCGRWCHNEGDHGAGDHEADCGD